jgi:hypothetical protein
MSDLLQGAWPLVWRQPFKGWAHLVEALKNESAESANERTVSQGHRICYGENSDLTPEESLYCMHVTSSSFVSVTKMLGQVYRSASPRAFRAVASKLYALRRERSRIYTRLLRCQRFKRKPQIGLTIRAGSTAADIEVEA